MDRRTRVALTLLVAGSLGGALHGAAVGVEAAWAGGRWRRALAGTDGVSEADARLAPVRALVPPGAVVGLFGDLSMRQPGDEGWVLVVRYALAPRRVVVGARAAPWAVAVGDVAPVGSTHVEVARLGPGLTLLRRVE